MSRCFSLSALIGALALLCSASAHAASAADATVGLREVEQWAVQSADAMTLTDLQAQLAQVRLRAAEADAGARWTVGGTTGSYIDPVSDTATRNYSGFNAVAGIRWPILGSAPAANRDVQEARLEVRLEPLRRAYAQSQVLHDVRQAYWTYVFNQRLLQIAQRWLALEPEVIAWTQARTRAHLLLDADRRALQSGFYVARRDAVLYGSAAAAALDTLQRLTGRSLNSLDTHADPLMPPCLERMPGDTQWDTLPLLALKRGALQAREAQAGDSKWNSVQAGVSLQQSLGSTYGGAGGQSTVLGIDMTIPLDLHAAHSARAAEARLRLQQAQVEWNAARQQLQSDWALARSRWQAVQADVLRARQRVATSAEGVREAQERVAGMEGDVLEKALVARYDLYQSVIDLTDTLRRSALLMLDFPDFADVVEFAPGPVDSQASGGIGSTTTATARCAPQPDWGSDIPDALDAPMGGLSPRASSAWFLWDGDRFIDAHTLQLPTPAGHLWVSFSPQRLRALQQLPAAADALRRALEQAHRSGWQVDWVVSDATFLLPNGVKQLRQLVRNMSSFAFDGLNLDCERSDLPPDEQAAWGRLLLSAVTAIRSEMPWPLTVTAHYREFQDQSLVAEWRAAGIQGMAAMVYVRDPQRVQAIAADILQRQAGMPMWLVASVEAELPVAESLYSAGQHYASDQWQVVTRALSGFANFHGIAVQSLDQFSRMNP